MRRPMAKPLATPQAEPHAQQVKGACTGRTGPEMPFGQFVDFQLLSLGQEWQYPAPFATRLEMPTCGQRRNDRHENRQVQDW